MERIDLKKPVKLQCRNCSHSFYTQVKEGSNRVVCPKCLYQIPVEVRKDGYVNAINRLPGLLRDQGYTMADWPDIAGWAWGPNWDTTVMPLLPDIWNKLHGDLFRIEGSDHFIETMRRVIAAYKKMKEESNELHQ